MQRITITEQDVTSSSLSRALEDAVFIPGFANTGITGKIVKCSTRSEFLDTFAADKTGTTTQYLPPTFQTVQYYPKYSSVATPHTEGFLEDAIPNQDGEINYIVTATTTVTGATVAVNKDTFFTKIGETAEGTWTFTYVVSGETGEWKLDGATADIAQYGITLTGGTPANNNTIVVTSVEDSRVVMFAAESIDPSYSLALNLLDNGITVYYQRINSYSYTIDNQGNKVYSQSYDVTVAKAYTMFKTLFTTNSSLVNNPLEKDFDIKFITCGGWPSFDYEYSDDTYLAGSIAACSRLRGDSISLIDHTNNPNRTLTGDASVFKSANNTNQIEDANKSFAAIFTPWCKDYSSNNIQPSRIYLTAYANSNKYNPSWLAVAGVSRGNTSLVTTFNTDAAFTNTIAESYQNETGVSINPVTYIKNYGYCIWGNRTLTKRTTNMTSGYATSFLNLRNLVSDVKKQAYVSAQSCMFEQNTDLLWTKFKSLMTPLLDQMVSGIGLKAYKLVKTESTNKTKINAVIKLYPIYSVESFDIGITITDDDVEVAE